MGIFSIREYGAGGDGTNDGPAVQKAIDACAVAGGGRVLCPPGTYRCGSLVLKSGVELHVEAGATILASAERCDYVKHLPFDAIVKNRYHANFDEPLLYACGAESIAITGRGTIDGNGRAFFCPAPNPDASRLGVNGWRPGMMVTLVECRDVLLRDIHLVDAPCYTVFPLGCERVLIEGITIENNRHGPNTDGIDLHCCRDVRIHDCSITAGDDCITCYSMPYWLKHPTPCENVTVTNCTLSTTCCGVRIGFAPSDLPVRNCTFSNLVMHNTRTGIDLLVPLDTTVRIEREPFAEHGPALENISFDNVVMDTDKALFLWTGPHVRPPAGMRNLSISNVIATTNHACFISGTARTPLEGLRISGVRLTMKGGIDGRIGLDPPEEVGCWGIPHAFYIRHAHNLALRDIAIDWGDAPGPWRSAVRARDVEGLEIGGLSASSGPGSDSAVVHLTDVRRAFLSGCRAFGGRAFLRLDGETTTEIGATGNDLTNVGEAFDAPSGVLREGGNILPP